MKGQEDEAVRLSVSCPAKKRIEKDAGRFLPTRIFCCSSKLHMSQTQRRNDIAKERRLQVVLPLDLGLRLPEDKSLSLLIEITEEMDYRELYAAYERREAAGEASGKLVVFGFMNGYYSPRSISAVCRYDIRMMYLLHRRCFFLWSYTYRSFEAYFTAFCMVQSHVIHNEDGIAAQMWRQVIFKIRLEHFGSRSS